MWNGVGNSAAKCILLRYFYTLFDSSVFSFKCRSSRAPTHTHTHARTIPYTMRAFALCLQTDAIPCVCVCTARPMYINQWKNCESDCLCYVLRFCFDHFTSYVLSIQCADNVCTERIARSLSDDDFFSLIVFNRIENIFFLFSMISPILSDILFSLFFACASISVFCFKFSNIAFD